MGLLHVCLEKSRLDLISKGIMVDCLMFFDMVIRANMYSKSSRTLLFSPLLSRLHLVRELTNKLSWKESYNGMVIKQCVLQADDLRVRIKLSHFQFPRSTLC